MACLSFDNGLPFTASLSHLEWADMEGEWAGMEGYMQENILLLPEACRFDDAPHPPCPSHLDWADMEGEWADMEGYVQENILLLPESSCSLKPWADARRGKRFLWRYRRSGCRTPNRNDSKTYWWIFLMRDYGADAGGRVSALKGQTTGDMGKADGAHESFAFASGALRKDSEGSGETPALVEKPRLRSVAPARWVLVRYGEWRRVCDGSDAGGGTNVAHDAEEQRGGLAEEFRRHRLKARAFLSLSLFAWKRKLLPEPWMDTREDFPRDDEGRRVCREHLCAIAAGEPVTGDLDEDIRNMDEDLRKNFFHGWERIATHNCLVRWRVRRALQKPAVIFEMDDDNHENSDVNIENVNPKGGSNAGGGTGVAPDAEEELWPRAEEFRRQRVMARAFRGLRPLVGVPDSGCFRAWAEQVPWTHWSITASVAFLARAVSAPSMRRGTSVLVRRSP